MRSVAVFVFLMVLQSMIFCAEKTIIPEPQEVQWGKGQLIVNGCLDIKKAFKKDGRLDQAIGKALNQIDQQSGKEEVDMFFGTAETWRGKRFCKKNDLSVPTEPEAYVLKIDEDGAGIVGTDAKGLFYGVQTLRQLIGSANGKSVLPYVIIEDKPALEFRGVHFFTGKNALREQKNMVDMMAYYKMNNLVLQVDYMKFDSHPEIEHPAFAQEKSEVKELIAYARSQYVEVTPLIPTLGHAEWIFQNGHHDDIVEYPGFKYAYQVLNPNTYVFVRDIFEELMELFEPKFFHIGHDEVATLSIFPYREDTKLYSETELLHKDLDQIAEIFSGKDVQLMLWSDMYLAEGQSPDACNAPSKEIAYLRRSHLKGLEERFDLKPIVMCDWHYASVAAKQYDSIKIFEEQGFRSIASTWSSPGNICNFAWRTIAENGFGLLQTTWAGYNFSIENNEGCHDQFAAYLLAADYSWSGREDNPSELPYDYRQTFWEFWYKNAYAQNKNNLKSTVFTDKQLKKFMASNIKTKIHMPLSNTDMRDVTISFKITNPFSEKMKMHLQYDSGYLEDNLSFSVEPNGIFEWKKTYSVDDSKVEPREPIKLPFHMELGSYADLVIDKELFPVPTLIASKKNSEIKIDGDLSEWKDYPEIVLNEKGYAALKPGWTSEDLNVKFHVAHDAEAFYLGVDVEDNVFNNPFHGQHLWQGDSLQIAMDFLNDKTEYYGPDELEFGVCLYEGKISKFGWTPSTMENSGFTKRVDAAIINKDGHTFYELRIPKDVVEKEYASAEVVGFCMAVNDNDGEEFNGGMLTSNGIYGTKDPSKFGLLILE